MNVSLVRSALEDGWHVAETEEPGATDVVFPGCWCGFTPGFIGENT